VVLNIWEFTVWLCCIAAFQLLGLASCLYKNSVQLRVEEVCS
jgi:hypothetical protein